MSTKFFIFILLIVGAVIAIFQGVPQRTWQWAKTSEIITGLFSIGAGTEEKLPGPLRGFLDPNSNSKLTVSGVVEQTNLQREQNGLNALHYNVKLEAAAEAKVDDMFKNQYFEHESPDGKSPADIIKAEGYEFITVGENLALGNFKDDKTLVQAWMDSPGHRANILNSKYFEIGVAVRKGTFEGKEVWLAVQEFGAPLSTCPGPSSGLKARIDTNRNQLTSMQADLQRKKAELESSRYGNEEQYNKAVEEYNDLAESINTLAEKTQSMVEDYNESVAKFNSCLESNS
jgi:uncharacterized protein YkwD